VTATVVSLSGVSRSAISRRKPGASYLGPSSPQVLVSSSYAPSQSSGFPMVPPVSADLRVHVSPCPLAPLCYGAFASQQFTMPAVPPARL